MSRQERIKSRNKLVRDHFADLEKKYPQWKLSALLEETAKKFPPISSNTVSAIIRRNGVYAE